MPLIEEKNVGYKCNFCGEIFKKCSDCAKHIEEKCVSGIIFPTDILVIDISKEIDITKKLGDD